MKKQVILAIATLFSIGACSRAEKTPSPDGVNPVIIEILNARVFLEEYHFYRQKNYPELPADIDDQTHSHIFDRFKRDLLIAEISQAQGFRITDDQVNQFINTKLTSLSFELLPSHDQGLWRNEIKRRLAIVQFLHREILNDFPISDDRIAEYYEANEDRFKKETAYQLRFAQTKTREQADQLRAALKKSKEPFAEVAKDYAENEGYQLVISLKMNELAAPFQKAVGRLKPGQFTKIIPIKQGETDFFYIIYLESLTEAHRVAFEDAYYPVQTELEKERCRKLLDEKIRQFENKIPMKVHLSELPFTYLQASQRNEV